MRGAMARAQLDLFPRDLLPAAEPAPGQRELARAIKRARFLALLPYVVK